MAAQVDSNNKQRQNPHKQSLETKTIRSKSWPHALIPKRHLPAITVFVAGFFIAFFAYYSPVQGLFDDNDDQGKDTLLDNSTFLEKSKNPDINDGTGDKSTPSEPTESTDPETNTNDQSTPSGDSNGTTYIRIESRSTSSADSGAGTEITVDDQRIEPDSNGRFRKNIDTGSTEIKIRGKIDSNGSGNNSSINMRTESSVSGETP